MIVTGLKIEIGQINAIDLKDILVRQNDLEVSMKKLIDSKNLDVILIAVTDILECNSEILVLGNRVDVIEKAFNVKLESNRAFLPGVVSRKKQIAPQIMEASK